MAPENPLVEAPPAESNSFFNAGTGDNGWATGISIAESAMDTFNGIKDGNWVEAGLGMVGLAADAAAMAIDPFGTLLSSAASFLMEHMQPLKEVLDWLAGNPPVIESYSTTWNNVGEELGKVAEDYRAAVAKGTAGWEGAAAAQYLTNSQVHGDALSGAASAASTVGTVVGLMGMVVGFVREMVRDLIADLVGKLIAWVLEAAFTLGFGTPVIVAQAVTAISKWAARIAKIIKDLLSTIKRVSPMLKRLVEVFEKIMKVVGKLAGKATGLDVLDPKNIKKGGFLQTGRSDVDGPSGTGRGSGDGNGSGDGDSRGNGSGDGDGSSPSSGNAGTPSSRSGDGTTNTSGSGPADTTTRPGPADTSPSGTPGGRPGRGDGNGSPDNDSPRGGTPHPTGGTTPGGTSPGTHTPTGRTPSGHTPGGHTPSGSTPGGHSPVGEHRGGPGGNSPSSSSHHPVGEHRGGPGGNSPAPGSHAPVGEHRGGPGGNSAPGGHSPGGSSGGSPSGGPSSGGHSSGGHSPSGGGPAPARVDQTHSSTAAPPDAPARPDQPHTSTPQRDPNAPGPHPNQPTTGPGGNPPGGAHPGGANPSGGTPSSTRPGGGGWTGTPGSRGDVGSGIPSARTPEGPRPSHAGPPTTSPSHAGPSHNGPSHHGPSPSGPSHAGPPHSGPPHAGPTHGGPSHTAPPNTGPSRQGMPHSGPSHAGPPQQRGPVGPPRTNGPGSSTHPTGPTPPVSRGPAPAPNHHGPGTDRPGNRPDGSRPDQQRPDQHRPDGGPHDVDNRHRDGGDDRPHHDGGDPDGAHHGADDRPGPDEVNRRHAESTPAGTSFHRGDDDMGDLPHRVQPDPDGRYTVDVHVTPDGRARIGDHTYSPEEFADILRRNGDYDGRPIRLIGCDAGSNDFARRLSRELDTPVLAPNKPAWTDSQGRVFSSDYDVDANGNRTPRIPPNGEWDTHHPDGSTSKGSDDAFTPDTADADKHDLTPEDARSRGDGDDPDNDPSSDASNGTDNGDAPDPDDPEYAPPPKPRVISPDDPAFNERFVDWDRPTHRPGDKPDDPPRPIDVYDPPIRAEHRERPTIPDGNKDPDFHQPTTPDPVPEPLRGLDGHDPLRPYTAYPVENANGTKTTFYTDENGRVKWVEAEPGSKRNVVRDEDGNPVPVGKEEQKWAGFNPDLAHPLLPDVQYRVPNYHNRELFLTFHTDRHGQTDSMTGDVEAGGQSSDYRDDQKERGSQRRAQMEGEAAFPPETPERPLSDQAKEDARVKWAGGHLLANELGGLGEYLNMHPQMAASNSGNYKDGWTNAASWRAQEVELKNFAEAPGQDIRNYQVRMQRDADGVPGEVTMRWQEVTYKTDANGQPLLDENNRKIVDSVVTKERVFPNKPEVNYGPQDRFKKR
ncbi:hypothetical protein [Saccharothrix australiensis]|uniref:DNA/RNA non-specific endonuclease n=1 Tax=Saccharothrix australiensis TaxID=2072 RepID=A0A495W0A8_9PSEU|nr:hypothetical protein [Saccharothrix australiensis]RKT55132.1 hypothetical protein C8E97_3788 [Saccharothrix australiensis]